jgi:outer membrane protein TolC
MTVCIRLEETKRFSSDNGEAGLSRVRRNQRFGSPQAENIRQGWVPMTKQQPKPDFIRFWRLLLILPLLAPAAARGSSATAQDQPVLRLSLRAAREYALEHSFETRKAGYDVEAARQKVRETVASGFPQISSNISYNNNLILATSLIPNFFDGKPEEKIPVQFGTQHNASANIQLQQLLFNGSYLVGLQTSKVYTDLAEHGLERSALAIQEAVTSTYFTILVAEESERILLSNLENIEKTRGEILELLKEGFVAETDADLIQITVNQLRNAFQTVGRQKEVAFKLFKFQLGLGLDEEVALTDTLEDVLGQADVEETLEVEFDLAASIDFQLAQTQERLAEKALKNEKSRYWPSVSAFFTYQQNAYRDSFSFFSAGQKWFPLSVLGFSVSFPVFKSGGQRARVHQAEAALAQAQNATVQAERGLQLEAERARIRLLSARENFETMRANRELAEKVYGVTLEKYREGVASSMELTQASDKALQAQSSYILALSELLGAKNSLDRINNNYPTSTDKGLRP